MTVKYQRFQADECLGIVESMGDLMQQTKQGFPSLDARIPELARECRLKVCCDRGLAAAGSGPCQPSVGAGLGLLKVAAPENSRRGLPEQMGAVKRPVHSACPHLRPVVGETEVLRGVRQRLCCTLRRWPQLRFSAPPRVPCGLLPRERHLAGMACGRSTPSSRFHARLSLSDLRFRVCRAHAIPQRGQTEGGRPA